MIKNLDRAQRKLKKLSKEMEKELDKQLVIGANQIRSEAIKSMKSSPADASRTYTRRTVTHSSSFPANAPRVDTGNLVNSITVEGARGKYSVGSRSQAPYGKWLEFGTSTILARPWLYPAFLKVEKQLKERIKKVLNKELNSV